MYTSQKTVRSGLFEDKDSAETAYQAAIKRGYKPDDISVVMSEDTKKRFYGDNTVIKTETGDKSAEGLAYGGAIGGTVVGIIGAITALSSVIVIPPLGLVIAGPLAAGLIGAGAGSIAGGFLGALIGAGIPEERAKIYENGVKKGGIVLTVHSEKDDEDLVNDWRNSKGKDIF
jgi:hypothetical protein